MKILACLATAIMLYVPGATAHGADDVQTETQALFESKCSQCHSIDRPKSKKKTAGEWESTVMRMKNVNGCPITDEEAKKIIEYLTATYGSQ